MSSRRKRRGKASKTASGLHDTNKTYVRQRQKCPHASLQPEFLGRDKAPSFDDLNLPLFVAGELEIILNGKRSSQEVVSRLELLKKTAYRADFMEFSTLRDIHCAVLRKIENGYAKWDSDFSAVERQVLESRLARGELKSVKKKKFEKGDRSSDKKWYCRFFNKGECEHSEFSHKAILYGEERHVYHFCSTCWNMGKGEQLRHSAESDDCPKKL